MAEQQSKALEKLEGLINDRIIEVQSLSQRVNKGKNLHDNYEKFIDDMIRDRVPPGIPAIAEGIGFVAEVFSLKWEDALKDASIKLATTFGPEVAKQAYEKFQELHQA